jgi:hypothetical protein
MRTRKSKIALMGTSKETVFRRTVNEFFIVDRQKLSLKEIQAKLKQTIVYSERLLTQQETLHTWVFKWKNSVKNCRILKENFYIGAQRISYL